MTIDTRIVAENTALDDKVRHVAAALADVGMQVLAQQFPHKLDHLILDATDMKLPVEMHPVFGGCYDWHSSVHMHWSMLRLCALAPNLKAGPAICEHLDSVLTPELVARELAYVNQPGRNSFERPYGWAWLLKLQAELEFQSREGHGGATTWAEALRPLSSELAQRLQHYLRQIDYPQRTGTHPNTAFAMLLANDYARGVQNEAMLGLLSARARHWFGADKRYPASYEPSGTDFLSAGLCEALLMARLLPAGFASWWQDFQPIDMSSWLTPAKVSNRTDPHTVHLDGLNLSRAWCLRELSAHIPETQSAVFRHAADVHWSVSWPHVATGSFVATHWLMSFALLR